MQKIIITILLISFSVSCTYFSGKEKNKEVIGRDTFTQVLVEMHIADVVLGRERKMDRDLIDTTGKKSYYNTIFKKYKVNEYRFNKTVEFYGLHSAEYSEIYKEVVDELSARRAKVDSAKNIIGKEKRDSVKKINRKSDTLRKHTRKMKINR